MENEKKKPGAKKKNEDDKKVLVGAYMAKSKKRELEKRALNELRTVGDYLVKELGL